MNKENAYQYLPLVQALVNGKTIQIKNDSCETECWQDFEDVDQIQFCEDPSRYRIKPRTRTFQLWINRDSGSTRSHQPADKLEWERITVREVLND